MRTTAYRLQQVGKLAYLHAAGSSRAVVIKPGFLGCFPSGVGKAGNLHGAMGVIFVDVQFPSGGADAFLISSAAFKNCPNLGRFIARIRLLFLRQPYPLGYMLIAFQRR